MVESTVDVNFYKRALLEELIEEINNMLQNKNAFITDELTWIEKCAYKRVIKHLESRLDNFKEDTDE